MAGIKGIKRPADAGRVSGISRKGKGGKSRGKLPEKTTINLVIKDENSIKPQIAVPAIILICLLAAVFGKFAVADRLISASRAAGQVTELRSGLDSAYEKLAFYADVEDKYAHYTYSGMTEEELTRVDRVDVMKLVEKALAEGYTLRSWTVSENIMTLQMTGSSLKELNRLSQILEQEPIVDQCVITTADRSEKNDVRTDVAATFTIYLQRADQETTADQAAAIPETAAAETEGGDGQ